MHCHHGSTAKLWKSIEINELDLRFDAASGSLRWVEGSSPCVASSLFETKLALFLCVAGWLIWSPITKIAFSSSRVVCSGITWVFFIVFSFQNCCKNSKLLQKLHQSGFSDQGLPWRDTVIHLNIHGPKTAASPPTRVSFSSYLKLGSLRQLANERAVGKAWGCWVLQFLPNSNRNVHSSHICACVSGNLIPPRLFMYTLNFPSSIAYEKLETSQPLILSKKSTPMLHIAPKSLKTASRKFGSTMLILLTNGEELSMTSCPRVVLDILRVMSRVQSVIFSKGSPARCPKTFGKTNL